MHSCLDAQGRKPTRPGGRGIVRRTGGSRRMHRQRICQTGWSGSPDARGALLRKRTVNNRTSGQSPGFLRAARKAAARSARRPGPGNGSSPSAQDGRRHGRQGTIPRRRRAQCRMASPKKHGGRRRQQQATAGTVSGEKRRNRTGNGYCPCLRDKHSPHRTQGSGPKSTAQGQCAGSMPQGRIVSRPGWPFSFHS